MKNNQRNIFLYEDDLRQTSLRHDAAAPAVRQCSPSVVADQGTDWFTDGGAPFDLRSEVEHTGSSAPIGGTGDGGTNREQRRTRTE
ncbi:hypothetical protein F2P81_002922 [Scophthalmus maximus]|uniref:Uncharacterized protein n=1 Tax=Scophthalmus maximus TaxID=52904 RepID=A0A6A4TKN4_SCOMX|nr:hypothetical protein F2P81_002922 [Scophthalmus maximus]